MQPAQAGVRRYPDAATEQEEAVLEILAAAGPSVVALERIFLRRGGTSRTRVAPGPAGRLGSHLSNTVSAE